MSNQSCGWCNGEGTVLIEKSKVQCPWCKGTGELSSEKEKHNDKSKSN